MARKFAAKPEPENSPDRKAVAVGKASQSLLESEAFASALAAVREQMYKEWTNTDSLTKREEIFSQYSALERVVKRLAEQVQAGENETALRVLRERAADRKQKLGY